MFTQSPTRSRGISAYRLRSRERGRTNQERPRGLVRTTEPLEAVDAGRWWIHWHSFARLFGGIAAGAVVGSITHPWLVVVGAMLGTATFVVGTLDVNSEAQGTVASFERGPN